MLWLNDQFVLEEEIKPAPADERVVVAFVALRTGKPLIVEMDTSGGGKCTLRTDDMELAASLIQSLVHALNIVDMQVVCDFPAELGQLAQTFTHIDELNSVKQQLVTQMADHSNMIRNLVVRAEDSRLMDDM